MAAITQTPTAPVGARLTIPTWTWFLLAVGLFVSYVAFQENGLLLDNWATVHEFFHDGRHALGFPCH